MSFHWFCDEMDLYWFCDEIDLYERRHVMVIKDRFNIQVSDMWRSEMGILENEKRMHGPIRN